MKKIICVLLMLAMLMLAAGCGEEIEEPHINIGDMESGAGITNAGDLAAFFESGGEKAVLARSVDLGDIMLTLSAQRGAITIEGRGNTISGNADCVIRLEDGAELTLDNVNITGGAEGIGGLGSGKISGSGAINAVSHAVNFAQGFEIGAQSSFYIKSNRGSALRARSISIGEGCAVYAQGGESASAVNAFEEDILLDEGALLEAVTETNYNALKCTGTFIMQQGSTLKVKNNGEYHGAELNDVELYGVVTIEATGGDKGVGLFAFSAAADYYALGFCEPEMVIETGNGSITFVETAEDIPTPSPEPTPAGEE